MKNLIIQILEKLACKHQWETFSRTKIYENHNDPAEGKLPTRSIYIFVCKNCGKIKKISTQ